MDVSTHSVFTREIAKQAVAAPPNPAEQWARVFASGVFLLAAAYTIYAARGMSGGMTMPGNWTMPMMWMVMPGQSLAGSALLFLLMWQAMMIAMMLPSSWPSFFQTRTPGPAAESSAGPDSEIEGDASSTVRPRSRKRNILAAGMCREFKVASICR